MGALHKRLLRSLLDASDIPCNSEGEIPLALPLPEASTPTRPADVLLLRPYRHQQPALRRVDRRVRLRTRSETTERIPVRRPLAVCNRRAGVEGAADAFHRVLRAVR